MKRVTYGQASSPETAEFFAPVLELAWRVLKPKGIDMSYSFNFRSSSKGDALTQAQKEFKAVVAQQPVHVQDVEAALDVIDAYLGLLATDATRDVMVTVNGSLSYTYEAGTDEKKVPLSSASVSVSAYLTTKLAPELAPE